MKIILKDTRLINVMSSDWSSDERQYGIVDILTIECEDSSFEQVFAKLKKEGFLNLIKKEPL